MDRAQRDKDAFLRPCLIEGPFPKGKTPLPQKYGPWRKPGFTGNAARNARALRTKAVGSRVDGGRTRFAERKG